MQKNRFKSMSVATIEQWFASSDKVFLITLTSSLILHVILLIVVLNVKLSEGVSQDEYAEWIRKISDAQRQATVVPIKEEFINLEDDIDDVPDLGAQAQAEKGLSKGSEGKDSPKGGTGSEQGGGTGSGKKSIGSRGVLGVIGVASESGGEFADVFSSGVNVSEDTSDVLEGKKSTGVAAAGSQFSRKRLGDGGGSGDSSGSSGAAVIGDVGVSAGGRVQGGQRQNIDVRAPRIAMADADVSSGLDKRAASTAILKKNSGFRRCYERALKADADLRGKLVFEISIDTQGVVIEISFVEDTLRNAEVRECVKGILKRLVFARVGDKIATLKNTLIFEPQE